MRQKNVCVIGIGYVGLPLSIVLAESGFKVIGVDKNRELVKRLNKGQPHIYERGLNSLLKRYLNNELNFSHEIPEDQQDVFIITVGTPIDKDNGPVLDNVKDAIKAVSEHISDKTLVILRSTIPVGTSQDVIIPILKKKQSKILFAFCPERIIEGVAIDELRKVPQIIGGIDEESIERAAEIFGEVTPTIIRTSSVEAAELIKLIDNVYRDLNFAFANEIALISEIFNLDALEVIQSVNMGYPRTNVALPGFVGGTCLTKDCYLLNDSLRKYDYDPILVKAGRKMNVFLLNYIAEKVEKRLKVLGKKIENSKIFITGLAFKGNPETDDMRDSPALYFLDYFVRKGTHVFVHDFVISKEKFKNKQVNYCNLASGFKEADCVIIMNNHQRYYNLDIDKLISTMNTPALFVDSWRIFERRDIEKNEEIVYTGIGIR